MNGSATVDQLIQLGDALKALNGGPDVPRRSEGFTLPQGWPLYTTITNASEIFGIGDGSIRALLKRNADFPALRIGNKYIIDVPGLYAWLHERNGTEILEGITTQA